MIITLITMFIFACIFFIGLKRSINIVSSIKWSKEKQKIFDTNKLKIKEFPYFVILLPMLREQSIVENTLNYFNAIVYPKNKLKIIVITTEKENEDKKFLRTKLKRFLEDIYVLNEDVIKRKYIGLFSQNIFSDVLKNKIKLDKEKFKKYLYKTFDTLPSTYYIAKKTIDKLNRRHRIFHIVHYPYKRGRRTDQLNYFIRKFYRKIKKNKEKIYIGVYDADSRPDKDTLLYIAFDVSEGFKKIHKYPETYQQPTLYLKNISRKTKNIGDILFKSNALFQTMWCLGYELPNLRKQFKLVKNQINNPLFRRSVYCTGHGEFFRLDILEKIKFFPKIGPADGITTGYILNLLDIPIKPLPLFDLVEIPLNILNMFKQHTLWFAGSVQMKGCLDYVRSMKLKFKFKNIFSMFERYLMDFWWGWGSFTLFILSVITLSNLIYQHTLFDLLVTIEMILAILMYYYMTIFIMLGNYEKITTLHKDKAAKLSFFDRFFIFIFGPLLISLKSVGPNLYMVKKLRNFFKKEKISYDKTER